MTVHTRLTILALSLFVPCGPSEAADPDARRKPALELEDPFIRMRSVCVSPDGKCVAGLGHDSRIRIWALPSGKLLHRLDEGPREVGGPGLTFTGDSRYLVVLSERVSKDLEKVLESRLTWWDPKTGKAVRVLAGRDFPGGVLAQSPDGKLMVTTATDGIDPCLYLREAHTARLVGRIVPAESPHQILFTPDSARLIGRTRTGAFFVWDVKTREGKLWKRKDPDLSDICGMIVTPSGQLVVASDGVKYPVGLINTKTGEVSLASKFCATGPRCLATARGGAWLLVASSNRLCVTDPLSGETLFHQLLDGIRQLKSIDVTADGKWLVSLAHGEDVIKVWKLSDW